MVHFSAGYVVLNTQYSFLFFNMTTSFVAPWHRENIPDYGPMSPLAFISTGCSIGLVSTIFYEYSGLVFIRLNRFLLDHLRYFTLIDRGLAYPAIWIPLFLWILSTLSREKQQQCKDFQNNITQDQNIAFLRENLTKSLKHE